MTNRALPEKTKQKIAKLLDKRFAKAILSERLPKFYPDFAKLLKMNCEPYKRHIGVSSAVFVVEYQLKYQDKQGNHKSLDIFVSAHSDGSRRGAYEKTRVLYEHGFDQGDYKVTRPLFYLKDQKAFFYESSLGRSLFHFFTQDPRANLRPSLTLAAGWVKKLHQSEIKHLYDWSKFQIASMVPPPAKFIEDFSNADPKLGKKIRSLMRQMGKLEAKFAKDLDQTVIYGDYHPENVIVRNLQAHDMTMIDFTDVAVGDPMADLGTFIQQFDFMGHNFISRQEMYADKQFFIETYFGRKLADIDINFINRINLYQAWTAVRSAVFLFYMKDVDNPMDDVLEDSQKYLDLAARQTRAINLY